jgi:hypothetical protein
MIGDEEIHVPVIVIVPPGGTGANRWGADARELMEEVNPRFFNDIIEHRLPVCRAKSKYQKQSAGCSKVMNLHDSPLR